MLFKSKRNETQRDTRGHKSWRCAFGVALVGLNSLIVKGALVDHMRSIVSWKHNCQEWYPDGGIWGGGTAAFETMIDDNIDWGYNWYYCDWNLSAYWLGMEFDEPIDINSLLFFSYYYTVDAGAKVYIGNSEDYT